MDCPAYQTHLAQGIAPVADAFTATVYSDVVDASLCDWVQFVRIHGVGTTGTSTVTVQACDNTTPSNRTAVAFKYRVCTTADTWGALTDATTAGFTTTAGSNGMYEIWVDTRVLAATGYQYVQTKFVEVVDDPVLGAVIIQLHGLRNKPNVGSAVP